MVRFVLEILIVINLYNQFDGKPTKSEGTQIKYFNTTTTDGNLIETTNSWINNVTYTTLKTTTEIQSFENGIYLFNITKEENVFNETTTIGWINNVTTATVIPTTKSPSGNDSGLNNLYFLFLILPILAVIVGVYYFYVKTKRRKKESDENRKSVAIMPYKKVETFSLSGFRRNRETRRLATPSWIFKEPEYRDDEEDKT